MDILNATYEIVQQEPGIEGMYKMVEYGGRVCYHSEDKIGIDSSTKFIDMMKKSKHMTPLEHGTVYLKTSDESVGLFYLTNEYSKVKIVEDCHGAINNHSDFFGTFVYYITTNYRVIIENNRESDLKYWCEPEDNHYKRTTVKFTCDIGVTREFNRHRKASINEESTRYCNYNKSKFGGSLNIIHPAFFNNTQNEKLNEIVSSGINFNDYCGVIATGYEEHFSDIDIWMFANMAAEYSYMKLINMGWKPQEARTILPLDTKSTLIYTMFDEDWKHFFDLRAYGTTGAPHPSAKELALPLAKEMKYDEENIQQKEEMI